MQQIFESYTLKNTIDYGDQNPCQLGFAHQLMSIIGYNPMQLSSFFSAVQRISSSIGTMPWVMKSFDETDIPDNHWFNSLFDNCLQTQFVFTKGLIKDVILNGNGFALIQRKNGVPANLFYLPAGTCSAMIDTINNKIVYNVSYNGKLNKQYEAKDIIHIFLNSNDGLIGKPLVDYAEKSIKLSTYTEKAASDYYGSGMRLTGILSTDAPRLTDKQRNEIRTNYIAGINSENGLAVLEAGMKFEQLSNNAKDAQLIDTRQYNIQEMSRWFNISPVLLGDLTHTQYNSIEQAQLDFVTNTLTSYVIMLEEELNRKLLSVTERKKYYIDIDQDILIKQNKTELASWIDTLYKSSMINRNEGRHYLGLPSLGTEGEVFAIPYSGDTQHPSYNNSNQLNNQNQENQEEQNKS